MSYPNFRFGSSATTADTATTRLAPDNAAFTLSDYFSAVQNASRIRFSRPTVDGQGFEFAAPGARVRFRTDSNLIQLHLEATGLISRTDTFNGIGSVYADGVRIGDFETPTAAGTFDWSYNFGTTTQRQIDVVWPYCAATDLRGVTVRSSATMTTSTVRSSLPAALFLGDSITHGFNGTKHRVNWPARLCALRSWRELNHGYGGRQIAAVDGSIAQVAQAGIVFVLIGFNNFYPQTSLVTFRADADAYLVNLKAGRAASTVPIVIITPFYTPLTPGTPPVVPGSNLIDSYRQQWRDAVTAAGGTGQKIYLIEGTSLTTTNSFSDSIHPDDVDMAEIAPALSTALTSAGITL